MTHPRARRVGAQGENRREVDGRHRDEGSRGQAKACAEHSELRPLIKVLKSCCSKSCFFWTPADPPAAPSKRAGRGIQRRDVKPRPAEHRDPTISSGSVSCTFHKL